MEENAMFDMAEDKKQIVDQQKENARAHQVSYYSVLQISEVQLMIISGGLKVLANEIEFKDVGLTKDFNKYNSNYYLYFYGSCFALLCCGIIHDTLFNGKSYLLILIMNIITIFVQLVISVVQAISSTGGSQNDTDDMLTYGKQFTLAWVGFSQTFSNFFMTILIPLHIAAKNRKSLELTSAGTTLATINIFYWVVSAVLFLPINAGLRLLKSD